jgi:GDP-mannose transporter
MGIAKFRDFNTDEARKWFPISLLLIGMIYTGSKALQFLSIPVYTIFKNLTIILIAYGEVLWFGGSVTSMTLLSFGLMSSAPSSQPGQTSPTRSLPTPERPL